MLFLIQPGNLATRLFKCLVKTFKEKSILNYFNICKNILQQGRYKWIKSYSKVIYVANDFINAFFVGGGGVCKILRNCFQHYDLNKVIMISEGFCGTEDQTFSIQVNASLLSIRDFFTKHLKIYHRPQTFEW